MYTLVHNNVHCTRRFVGRGITFHLLTLFHTGTFTTLHHLTPTGLTNGNGNSLVTLIAASIRLLRVFFTRAVDPIIVTVIAAIICTLTLLALDPPLTTALVVTRLVVNIVLPGLFTSTIHNVNPRLHGRSSTLSSRVLSSVHNVNRVVHFNRNSTQLTSVRHYAHSL